MKWKNNEYRYSETVKFIGKHIQKSEQIIDLGVENVLSELIKANGFKIKNTSCDLDEYFGFMNYDVITAFEIFEHLFAPFNLLMVTKGKLVCSIPLNLWFAKAYWNDNIKRDCHYHEFEERQFLALLDRTGWQVKDSLKIKYYDKWFGFRPILRMFYYRYLIIYAEKF